MARNGKHPRSGRLFWRCRVANRERVAAHRELHPYEPHPRPVLSDAERELALRHRQAQHAYNRRARTRGPIYAERAETDGTDGESMIPLRYLWHPVPRLVELLERAFGDDLPRELEIAGLAGVYSATCRREHVNLAKCDRMLTRLRLHIDMLGEPVFSVAVPAREVVAA